MAFFQVFIASSGSRSHGIFAAEFVYTAGRVEQFLFAGIEGMALRTDFNVHVLLLISRTGLEGVPAAAGHGDLFVGRVYFRFHNLFLYKIPAHFGVGKCM